MRLFSIRSRRTSKCSKNKKGNVIEYSCCYRSLILGVSCCWKHWTFVIYFNFFAVQSNGCIIYLLGDNFDISWYIFAFTGAYLLTQKDVFLDRSHITQLLAYILAGKDVNIRIDLPPPVIVKVSWSVSRLVIDSNNNDDDTVEALVGGHLRDAKKVSVTGAGRLREWFS